MLADAQPPRFVEFNLRTSVYDQIRRDLGALGLLKSEFRTSYTYTSEVRKMAIDPATGQPCQGGDGRCPTYDDILERWSTYKAMVETSLRTSPFTGAISSDGDRTRIETTVSVPGVHVIEFRGANCPCDKPLAKELGP